LRRVSLRLIDYLDEPQPGTFRQATISFSSLIPNAFPLYDALTMAPHVWLYCDYGRLDHKQLLQQANPLDGKPAAAGGKARRGSETVHDATLTPNVMLLTKHSNGSLNLWRVTFAEESRFASVVSVSHVSRACGHRFHANSAACHPVLPLLLTTSHHNEPTNQNASAHGGRTNGHAAHMGGFCSELILWRVSPVGPLSKSGGITELARINSPVCSAFANVAWLPTLLPR
jgi:DmX-like protein